MFVGTILFMVNDGMIDKAITDMFYDSSLPLGERFFLENVQPWKWFNDNNRVYGYILLVFSLGMLVMGLIIKKYRFMVKYASFSLFTAIVGVWIIVNELFKGLYGRPRPRHTLLWPNSLTAENYTWYRVWDPVFLKDPTLIGEGVSFPSGHVSMLAIFIIIYFIFKHPEFWGKLFGETRYERTVQITTILKWTGVFLSVVFGILTSIGRIMVGAHYASDCLWAFGITYIFAWMCYHWLFRIPAFEQKQLQKLSVGAEAKVK